MVGYVATTDRARPYVEDDGLGIIPALIMAGVSILGLGYGAISGKQDKKKAKKEEEKQRKRIAAEEAKKAEAERKAAEEAKAQTMALALAEQQRTALEAQAADARAAAGRASLQGLVGPGVVLGILALGAWFALGRRR